MMNAFDIHKNLIGLLGALALAVMLSTSPGARADETNPADSIAENHDFVFGDGDMSELRELLSTPDLSEEERRILQRTLNSIHEEVAGAASLRPQPQGFVHTLNELLGIAPPDDGQNTDQS